MLSLFELFKIGIGPSSSHTVGPMIAAGRFVRRLESECSIEKIESVEVDLFGSLALTGKGHATDQAVLGGLLGFHPATLDLEQYRQALEAIEQTKSLPLLGGTKTIPFDPRKTIVFHFQEALPYHPNGMRFTARTSAGQSISEIYYSVGGGFVVSEQEVERQTGGGDQGQAANAEPQSVPHPFTSAQELIAMCKSHGKSIEQLVMENERSWRSDREIEEGIEAIWQTMSASIDRGCRTEGTLPGGLGVRRRAPGIFRNLLSSPDGVDPWRSADWVSLFALAVNEENAAGGRVVTAPTNGAAGIIPAVLSYAVRFEPCLDQAGRAVFLRTAAAIGFLYKRNASLSAAEMGCQGEVGVACSMAAAGMAAVLGGTPMQVENAAEIGMEHNLGLTCDPVAGLVQIPCIERNTMGAVKAINAARLAVLYGDGSHRVSLDRVIETMRQTGIDMQSKYKETSLGGLAVNVVNC